jgi:hypothetical protein
MTSIEKKYLLERIDKEIQKGEQSLINHTHPLIVSNELLAGLSLLRKTIESEALMSFQSENFQKKNGKAVDNQIVK